jgi:hypothetical protein
MSKLSKSRARARRKTYAKPSLPRAIGANDNGDAVAATVVIRGVTLTANQAHRLEIAEARLATRDPIMQRFGRDAMATLNAEIDRVIEAREREESEREMQELAAGRGETYQRGTGAVGSLSVKRDGLDTLAGKRKLPDGRTVSAITREQLAAGLRYRADYERLDPEKGLSPPDAKAVRGHAHGGDGWDTKLREAHDRMMRVRLLIAGIDTLPSWGAGDARAAIPRFPDQHPVSRALRALDEIAGKGRNVREMAPGGRAHQRIVRELRTALDAAAVVYDRE